MTGVFPVGSPSTFVEQVKHSAMADTVCEHRDSTKPSVNKSILYLYREEHAGNHT